MTDYHDFKHKIVWAKSWDCEDGVVGFVELSWPGSMQIVTGKNYNDYKTICDTRGAVARLATDDEIREFKSRVMNQTSDGTMEMFSAGNALMNLLSECENAADAEYVNE